MTILVNNISNSNSPVARTSARTRTLLPRNSVPLPILKRNQTPVTIVHLPICHSPLLSSHSSRRSVARCKTPYPFLNSSLSRSIDRLEDISALPLSSIPISLVPRLVPSNAIARTQEISKDDRFNDQILNLWQPTPIPRTLFSMTPMRHYDINTKLPFHILQTGHVRLEPLIVSLFGPAVLDECLILCKIELITSTRLLWLPRAP